MEVCPAGSKPSHCLILQKSLEPGNFSHSYFSWPSIFEAMAVLVICEQVSFKVSSGGHIALFSAALIPGKGCAGNSCAGFRDPVFSYPMVAQQQPGPRDCGPSSVFTKLSHSQSGNSQGSSQRSRAWQLSSLLSTLFACVFLFQLENHRSVTKPRCLNCHGLQRTQSPTDSGRVYVCVQRKAWCAICVCMHLLTLS